MKTSPNPKAEGDTPEYGRGTGVSHPVDIHVGKRIRMRRLLLGMNQEAIAGALGLTFQQVQKYERGSNQVSASRLSEMAEALSVPVSYFFRDLPSAADGEVNAEDKIWREQLEQPRTIGLVRFYYAISDPAIRSQLLEMIKTVAQAPSTKI